MASRAILRKRSLLGSSSHPRFLFHSFSSHEDSSLSPDSKCSASSWELQHQKTNACSKKETEMSRMNQNAYQLFSASGLVQQHLGGSLPYRSMTRIPEYAFSLGLTGTIRYMHWRLYSSTTAAGQPQERGKEAVTQVKDPSPEECD